jgi:trehalose 6-phosphate phosphatase
MIVASVEEAVARCLDVLGHHPSGVFSDFDGTLSSIAATPDAAEPFEGAVDAVRRIAALVDEFAIITGRAAADALDKIGLPSVRVIDNHGLEMILDGEHTANPIGEAAQASIAAAMDEITAKLTSRIDPTGMVFENKLYTSSIHFRNTADPGAIGEILEPIAVQAAETHDLRITGGKMMFELRPKTVVSKGTALGDLVQAHDLGGAIFIGDDVTDVDGFRILRDLRESSDCATLAVGVMSRETHPSVLEESDILLSGVSDTVKMLKEVADRLEAESASDAAPGGQR